MSYFQFLLQYIHKPGMIGAVAPSSKALVNTMLKQIDWKKARVIAEFGPGTGVITREILQRMRHDAHLTAFEVNADFCRLLEKVDDSRLTIRKRSAAKLDFSADVIVSSLPMNVFSIRLKQQILNASTKNLANNGKFVQFQYTRNLEPLLDEYFSDVKRSFIPLNIPPAFVYVCRK